MQAERNLIFESRRPHGAGSVFKCFPLGTPPYPPSQSSVEQLKPQEGAAVSLA